MLEQAWVADIGHIIAREERQTVDTAFGLRWWRDD